MKSFKYIILLLIPLIYSACSTTAHLKSGQILVKSSPNFKRGKWKPVQDSTGQVVSTRLKIKGSATLDGQVLESAIKTKSNRRILLPKMYLHLYNIGRSLQIYEYPFERIYKFFKPKGTAVDSLASFLVNIAGEAPEIMDSLQVQKDLENLLNVHFANGYFNARIAAQIDTIGQKANLTYIIQENRAYIIDTIAYHVSSSLVQENLKVVLEKSLLKKGENYNENLLTKERERISHAMRALGFYYFSPAMISYLIDTNYVSPKVLTRKEQKQIRPIKIEVFIERNPKIYTIREIILQMDQQIPPDSLLTDKELINHTVYSFRTDDLDDFLKEELKITDFESKRMSPLTVRATRKIVRGVNLFDLTRRFSTKEAALFNIDNDRKTQRRLQELGIFRFVAVQYEVDDSLNELTILIKTQLSKKYQLKTGVEGFTESNQGDHAQQSNLPGFGGQIVFRNKRLFKASEFLEFTTRGEVAFYNSSDVATLQSVYELGATANLFFPRLLVPLAGRYNLTQNDPKTELGLDLNTQQRVEFDRTEIGARLNYSWFHNGLHRKNRSMFSPFRLKIIQSELSDEFLEDIENIESDFLRSFIIQDYEPRFSSRITYGYTHSDYRSTRTKATHFVNPTIEVGGNFPYLLDKWFDFDGDATDGQIGELLYGQYFKTTFQYKSYVPITKSTEFVFRVFSGIAKPYNYTTQVPFDARFFSGGTNSMRGWQSNTLGPGTYRRPEEVENVEYLISPGGEFVLETNIEFRKKVVGFIELAVFSDVGNVWFLPGSNFEEEGGKLTFETFRPGWDMGIGMRFDFSFFVFRLDFAQQLYAPDVRNLVFTKAGKKVISDNQLTTKRYQLNFGIGYPF